MNRFLLVAIGSLFVFAATGGAAQDTLPTAEDQMKVLQERLDLTAEQRIKIKPIVQQLHETTQRLMDDKTLSREDRLARVRPHRLLADKKIRGILNAEQRKQLDQYESGPHSEVHGSLTGTPEAPVQ